MESEATSASGSFFWARLMKLNIETEQEQDGRWLAEVPDLPGVMAYGGTRAEAVQKVEALTLRVLAHRLENGEAVPSLVD